MCSIIQWAKSNVLWQWRYNFEVDQNNNWSILLKVTPLLIQQFLNKIYNIWCVPFSNISF
jgi:hypothetical protein